MHYSRLTLDRDLFIKRMIPIPVKETPPLRIEIQPRLRSLGLAKQVKDTIFKISNPDGKVDVFAVYDPTYYDHWGRSDAWVMHGSDKKQKVKRVDLAHRRRRISHTHSSIRDIDKEIESLSEELQCQAERLYVFFATYLKNLLEMDLDLLNLINYLEGKISLDQMGLNRANAARYLYLAKLSDLVFIRYTRMLRETITFENSTYGLRTRLLELLSPDIHTVDAYTFSLDLKKLRNIDYLKNPLSWVPERLRFYATNILPQEYLRMISLSQRLNVAPFKVYALKGGTATGKTTLAKERLKEFLDSDGELSGCINPDNMKFALKKKTTPLKILTNVQVHDEVVKGPLGSYRQAVLGNLKYRVVIDMRLSSNEDFEEVIEAAKLRREKALVIDMDAPLKLLMWRVIVRDPYGKDPCVLPEFI